MTVWVKSRCPITGDNVTEIQASHVRLLDHGDTYTFTYPCPSCGDQHHKPAGRDVVALLTSAGVATITLTGGELDDPARTAPAALGLLEVDRYAAALEDDLGPYLAAAAYRPAVDVDLQHVIRVELHDTASPPVGGDSADIAHGPQPAGAADALGRRLLRRWLR